MKSPRASFLGFYVALLIIVVCALVLWLNWGNIPETVPLHFGPSGEPDRWGKKSVGSASVGLWIAGALVLATWGIVAATKDDQYPPSLGPALGTAEKRARIVGRALTITWTGWVVAILAATIGFLQLAMVLPALEPAQSIALSLTLIGALGGVILMMVMIVRAMSSAGRPQPGDVIAEGQEERQRHVKWGVFYYNPDDPRLFVEKTVGVGMDFNYAKWQAKAVLAATLAALLLLVFL